MPFNELVAAVRSGLAWFLAAIVAGVLAGIFAFMQLPPTYASSVSLYVSAADATSVDDYGQGTLFVQGQIKTYPLLVSSVDVLDAASDTLGDIDTSDLKDRVSAEVPVDSTLMVITAEAPSGEDAAAIVDAVAEASVEQIRDIETRGDQGSAVDIQVINREGIPDGPVAPRLLILGPVGLMAGVLVGLLIVVVRYARIKQRKAGDAGVVARGR